MRKLMFAVGAGLVVVLCALLGAQDRKTTVKVRLQLVDAADGRKIGGMVRVFPADAKEPLELPGMLDRLRGLKKTPILTGWYVVPADGIETTLPQHRIRLDALSGLETALTR